MYSVLSHITIQPQHVDEFITLIGNMPARAFGMSRAPSVSMSFRTKTLLTLLCP